MARRKLTVPPSTLPTDVDLPKLTSQQLAFVVQVLDGKSIVEAYRRAYRAEGMTPGAVHVAAGRLHANDNIKAWLRAGRVAALERGIITLEGHLGELARLRQLALDSGNLGAAVQAEHYRGKAAGLYVERFEGTVHHIADDALIEALRVGMGAHVADQAAKMLGHGVTLDLEALPPPEPVGEASAPRRKRKEDTPSAKHGR